MTFQNHKGSGDNIAGDKRINIIVKVSPLIVILLFIFFVGSYVFDERSNEESCERPKNEEANEMFIQGKTYLEDRSNIDFYRAIKQFNKVKEIEPEFPGVYSIISSTYSLMIGYEIKSPIDVNTLISENANKSYQLDSTCSNSMLALGALKLRIDWDLDEAIRLLEKAIIEDSNNIEAKNTLIQAYTFINEFDTALELAKSYSTEFPDSRLLESMISWVYYYKRDYDKAIEAAEKNLKKNSSFDLSRKHLAKAYIMKGQYEDAMKQCEKHGDNKGILIEKYRILIGLGEKEKAESLQNIIQGSNSKKYIPPYRLAQMSLAENDNEKALKYLEECVRNKDGFSLWLSVEPNFIDKLRGEEYYKLLGKVYKQDIVNRIKNRIPCKKEPCPEIGL